MDRAGLVALGTLGYAALVGSTMVQTSGGRGPFDLGFLPTALALVGLTLLVASALLALRALAPRLHHPTTPSAQGA